MGRSRDLRSIVFLCDLSALSRVAELRARNPLSTPDTCAVWYSRRITILRAVRTSLPAPGHGLAVAVRFPALARQLAVKSCATLESWLYRSWHSRDFHRLGYLD